jgi:hypothetical protein
VVIEIEISCLTSLATPSKDEPPPLIDADGMEAFQLALQLLEMVAGRHS